MKKTTINNVINMIKKHPDMLKMLPTLFPGLFVNNFMGGVTVTGDWEDEIIVTKEKLIEQLVQYKYETKVLNFIIDLFNITGVELASMILIPGESILQKGLKAHYAAETVLKAKAFSIPLPDFRELKKCLDELDNNLYFCEIGQLFKRRSYPNNNYAPMTHNGKVRMVNITSSAVWNDPKCIPISELKDQWNKKRLTKSEFAKLVGTTDFNDFVKVDLTMNCNGSVKAQASIWQTETKAAWITKQQ